MISICYYFQDSGSATHFKDVYAHLCWKQSCRTGLSWNMGLRALQRGLGQMLKQGEMSGCASMFFASIPLVTPSTSIQEADVQKESTATRWAALSITERQLLAFGRYRWQRGFDTGGHWPRIPPSCCPPGAGPRGQSWHWAGEQDAQLLPTALAAPALEKTLHVKKCLKPSSSVPNFLCTQHCGIYTANTFLQAFTVN